MPTNFRCSIELYARSIATFDVLVQAAQTLQEYVGAIDNLKLVVKSFGWATRAMEAQGMKDTKLTDYCKEWQTAYLCTRWIRQVCAIARIAGWDCMDAREGPDADCRKVPDT